MTTFQSAVLDSSAPSSHSRCIAAKRVSLLSCSHRSSNSWPQENGLAPVQLTSRLLVQSV